MITVGMMASLRGAIEPKPKVELSPAAEARRGVARKVYQLGGSTCGVSVLMIVAYAMGVPSSNRAETFALLAAFSVAAVTVGAAFGFLFGIPRARVVEKDGTTKLQESSLTPNSTTPNTNLEQVSDWLTKILLGATLTQVGNIPTAAASLFALMAGALGGGRSAETFVGALVIYSAVVGFLLGWLATRTVVAWMLSDVDDPLRVKPRVKHRHAGNGQPQPVS